MSKEMMFVLELPVKFKGKNRDFAVWLSWMDNLARRLN